MIKHPFRSIMDLTADEWLAALGLTAAEIPDVVIVEGSWWRAQRQAWRLGYLSDVRELNFPDIFLGKHGERHIAFCMAYGAPRTVEIIYLFGMLGTRLAVQIGTCGGLQSHLKSGDILVPESALGRDGVSHLLGDNEASFATPTRVAAAETMLQARGHTVYCGGHVTFSSLFVETPAMMALWHQAGFLGVDMETATTFSTAAFCGMDAVSLLVVWDDLTRGKRFLDPLSSEEQKALDRANESVFEVALELV